MSRMYIKPDGDEKNETNSSYLTIDFWNKIKTMGALKCKRKQNQEENSLNMRDWGQQASQ